MIKNALIPTRAHPQRIDTVNTHKQFSIVIHHHLFKPKTISFDKESYAALSLQENSTTTCGFELSFHIINSLSLQLGGEHGSTRVCRSI